MSPVISTPEEIGSVYPAPGRGIDLVPAWARGTEARHVGPQVENDPRNAWDLYRGRTLVGCMYDLGAGYEFVQGARIAEGDWDDTHVAWAGVQLDSL